MFKIYKGRKSDVLSALTLNDSLFWSADVFVGIIFALFVTQTLGGSAIDVGLMFGLYRIVRAITAIPIGRYFDEHRGHFDEYYALMLVGLGVGLVYVLLSFSTELWHAYLGMVLIGVGHVIENLSWKVLFYSNVPEEAEGQINGIYEVISQLMYAAAMVIAGFVGEIFGFEWTLMFAGFITILSSFGVLMMYKARGRF